jgi:hypothetical protein
MFNLSCTTHSGHQEPAKSLETTISSGACSNIFIWMHPEKVNKRLQKTSGVSWYIKIPVNSNHNYIQNQELSLATSVLSTKGTIAVQ